MWNARFSSQRTAVDWPLAVRWLTAHDEHAPELRFDVVGVLVRAGRPALVTHLRAAFS